MDIQKIIKELRHELSAIDQLIMVIEGLGPKGHGEVRRTQRQRAKRQATPAGRSGHASGRRKRAHSPRPTASGSASE